MSDLCKMATKVFICALRLYLILAYLRLIITTTLILLLLTQQTFPRIAF